MTTPSASYLPIWTNGTPGTIVVTDPQYGAYGDGVHDDTAAINAAITDCYNAGGGVVDLGPGTFLVHGESQEQNSGYYAAIVLRAGVTLRGAGKHATIIRLAAAQPDSNAIVENYSIATGGDSRMRIADLTLDGQAAQQSGHLQYGIELIRVRDVVIENVRILNVFGTTDAPGGEGMFYEIVDSMDVHHIHCEAIATDANTSSGFSADGSTNISWTECLSYGMGKSMGYTHHGSSVLRYANCAAYLCYNNGFNSETSTDICYASCIAGGQTTADTWPYNAITDLANGSGFVCNGDTGVTYASCVASYNDGTGFAAVGSCDSVTYTSCVSHHNHSGSQGFNLPNVTRLTAGGCIAHANGQAGFFIGGSAVDAFFSGCIATDNGTSGTFAQGFEIYGDNTNVSLSNCRAGNTGTGTSQQYGIGFDNATSATSGIDVSGCDFSNNANGPVAGLLNNYKQASFSNNRGLNPFSTGLAPAPSVPASGTNQVNTYACAVRIYVSGGTVTDIGVNGTNLGLTGGQFLLQPGEYITLTYTAAPSWVWEGL